MKIVSKIGDAAFNLELEPVPGTESAFLVAHEGKAHKIEIIELKLDSVTMAIDNRVCFFEVYREKGEIKEIAGAARIFPVTVKTPQQDELERVLASYASSEAHCIKNTINSPMPGKILEILIEPGQKVEMGQVVAILEAMKMENEISSNIEGTVRAIKVSKGESVAIDQVLFEFDV